MDSQPKTQPWWKAAVAYQVYPRSFQDSNGDGIGDLPGLIGRLDYLHTLGIDLLWITPVYASPQVDNGYDISDYQAIDPTFGTLADVDRLIAECHRRGIRLIMDLVINHCSDQHPWFKAARSARDNPYRDWFVWRDPVDGREPNNWASHFAPSAWTLDEATGQYYLHTFAREQPDLNWQHPPVRAALHDMIRWWLARGIDGFRLDAISYIDKAPGLPSHEVELQYHFDQAPMMHGPDYHAHLRELHDQIFSHHDIVTVGECAGMTVQTTIDIAAPERRELDMAFLFEPVSDVYAHGMQPGRLKEILTRWQTGLHGRAWVGLGFNNHDQARVVSAFGDDSAEHRVASAKCFGTLLLTLQGTPFIYQGEELGMPNVAFDQIDDYQDLNTHHRYRQNLAKGWTPERALAEEHAFSRDNARTPMPWDASTHAGFTTGTPWLAVGPSFNTVNVAAALSDEGSVFHHYRQLIALRKQWPALVHGDFVRLDADDGPVFAYSRSFDDSRLVVVMNLGSTPASFSALPAGCELLLGNLPAGAVSDELLPWEARVYRLLD